MKQAHYRRPAKEWLRACGHDAARISCSLTKRAYRQARSEGAPSFSGRGYRMTCTQGRTAEGQRKDHSPGQERRRDRAAYGKMAFCLLPVPATLFVPEVPETSKKGRRWYPLPLVVHDAQTFYFWAAIQALASTRSSVPSYRARPLMAPCRLACVLSGYRA